ncbi:MAG: hypothetical protein JO202_15520 [Ktedonobacteraceae bacterium]|nr:hypothetical protein [Ktedonobacteraceae bacterium]
MTETNKPEERNLRPLSPLPELQVREDMAIAASVDEVLHTAISLAYTTQEQFQRMLELFEEEYGPEPLLERKKQFLAIILRKRKEEFLPEVFFAPLMRIAVYEANPSFNRSFIEPCLRAFGYRRVLEALLLYLERGTNREKAGAGRAFYWARLPSQKRRDEELAELDKVIATTMLKEFVKSDNLDVERSLIPQLFLKPSHYLQEGKRLIPLAIHKARHHPDEYIRHRIEIQLEDPEHRTGERLED